MLHTALIFLLTADSVDAQNSNRSALVMNTESASDSNPLSCPGFIRHLSGSGVCHHPSFQVLQASLQEEPTEPTLPLLHMEAKLVPGVAASPQMLSTVSSHVC